MITAVLLYAACTSSARKELICSPSRVLVAERTVLSPHTSPVDCFASLQLLMSNAAGVNDISNQEPTETCHNTGFIRRLVCAVGNVVARALVLGIAVDKRHPWRGAGLSMAAEAIRLVRSCSECAPGMCDTVAACLSGAGDAPSRP